MTKNQKNETEELEIFNIGKKYKKRTVLKNVSLHVKKAKLSVCLALTAPVKQPVFIA